MIHSNFVFALAVWRTSLWRHRKHRWRYGSRQWRHGKEFQAGSMLCQVLD